MRAVIVLAMVGLAAAVPHAQSPKPGAQSPGPAAGEAMRAAIDRQVQEILPKVIEWRRDFHKNPELGNREVRTAKIIGDYLKAIGFEVQTGIARTGLVGVLRGGRPGPVVALRADMDALPVTEQVDLPFKSTVKAEWNGQQVGVMHACGHDNHMAILLGTATVLAKMKDQLPGTVKVIFQPAEEGPPAGESPGGAELMVQQNVLENPKVDAIFGLHAWPGPAGRVTYRAGPALASADFFTVRVTGRQTHGAVPWGGVDPIVVGAQIVTALQTIVSRTVNVTESPAVVTVGRFSGGVRSNIIPETVEMEGTVRAFDETVRRDIHRRMRDIVTKYAEASGAKGELEFGLGYPVTRNDPALTERMVPTLKRVVGADAIEAPLVMVSEDFSYFQQKVPGLFVFLGVTPRDQDWTKAPANHSPLFFADESALPVGVRVMTNLAIDFLTGGKQ